MSIPPIKRLYLTFTNTIKLSTTSKQLTLFYEYF